MVKYSNRKGKGITDIAQNILKDKEFQNVSKAALSAALATNPYTTPLAPFVALIPLGGGLAEKYHKVFQFNPYEWEHIRESAKQKLSGGSPSAHWEPFGVTSMVEGVPKDAYLDIVRSHTPAVAGRLLENDTEYARHFGAALHDTIKDAAKWAISKADFVKEKSAKARALIDENLPKLIKLGEMARAGLERAEKVASAVAMLNDEKKVVNQGQASLV